MGSDHSGFTEPTDTNGSSGWILSGFWGQNQKLFPKTIPELKFSVFLRKGNNAKPLGSKKVCQKDTLKTLFPIWAVRRV